jgi:UDP-N-acetylmuramoyl-tripeptide--D-alanyl-D-alanine ligase
MESSGPIIALGIFAAVLWLVPISLSVRRSLHILQLEEYSNARFGRWAAANRLRSDTIWRIVSVAVAALAAASALLNLRPITVLLLIAWLAPGGALVSSRRPQPAKKSLVYTARIRRLIAAVAIIVAVLEAVTAVLAYLLLARSAPLAAAVVMCVTPIALLVLADYRVVVAGNVLAQPAEAFLRRRYLNDARRRVRVLSPKLIAITGSFGKTTTKEILASVLATRFSTMKTPESWNTLMGVTRAIRERLTEQHEIFVVEMGAYTRGEIAALCDLTGPPNIGILTGINEQHLERFGSIENTIRAKYELIDAVQPGGLAIFNVDNAHCKMLAARTQHARVVRVGLDPGNGPLDYTAVDVSVSPEGTRFTVVAGNEQIPFRSRLLGEHFILNVLAATAAAVECGMTLQQVAAAVAAIAPVAHRLQLMPGAGGITTIDDAYSANPDGARAALRVLSQMNGGKRILVTPGFVELGDREAELNRGLGELAASSCDILVLVGPRHTQPIHDGAVAAGMDTARIHVVGSVALAREALAGMAGPGDTILFENDLPDNYDE